MNVNERFMMIKRLLTVVLASAAAVCATAQQTAQRTSVLEEFSTTNCQYCPEGYQVIKKAMDSHPGTLWLVHHAGFMTDDITIPESERLTFLYGTNAFAPAYMIDRTVPSETYTDYSPVWPVDDSARVAGQLDEMAAKPCFATIGIGDVVYDAASRTVTAIVSGRVLDAFDTAYTRITLYLVEDSIVMPQMSTAGYLSDYMHMHAVRGCATEYLGSPVDFASDGSYSESYTYPLPGGAVAHHCRLVALLHYSRATNLTKNNILNAVGSEDYLAPYTVGIEDAAPEYYDLSLSPNPASGYAVVRSGETIRRVSVAGLDGRGMADFYDVDAREIRLETEQWGCGVYMVSVVTDNGMKTLKMIIKH